MKPATPTLRTERFVLRKIRRGDAPALFAELSDGALMRMSSSEPYVSQTELDDWLVPEGGWDTGRDRVIADNVGGLAIGILDIGILVSIALAGAC
jgi:ribosomal-protein-alanine N-acetyltransferase